MCDPAARPLSELSDEALIAGIRESPGSRELNDCFQEIFQRYQVRVTNWCFRITRDADRATDLTQEVFLRAFQRLDSFRGDSRLSTWLYTITRNHCLNAVKKRGTEPVDSGATMIAELAGSDGSEVHGAVERMESFQSLWRLMRDTLTPIEMRVLALHYGHEVPLAAITQRLVLSNPSGAKAYIVNARRKLHAVIRSRRHAIGRAC